jgi:hypothetical protein
MPRTRLLRSFAAALALRRASLLLASVPVRHGAGRRPRADRARLPARAQQRRPRALRHRRARPGRGPGHALRRRPVAQVYPFLPQFLEQRAAELVLLDQARSRGVVVDDERRRGGRRPGARPVPRRGRVLEVLAAPASATSTTCAPSPARPRRSTRSSPLIEAEVVLSELEVRVAYESSAPQLVQPEAEVCARHILVDDEAQAAELSAARAAAPTSPRWRRRVLDRPRVGRERRRARLLPRGA